MGRQVAIKVSAERFSDRFEREVHAVATLNHPNICRVYDVGPNCFVMEFLSMETTDLRNSCDPSKFWRLHNPRLRRVLTQ